MGLGALGWDGARASHPPAGLAQAQSRGGLGVRESSKRFVSIRVCHSCYCSVGQSK